MVFGFSARVEGSKRCSGLEVGLGMSSFLIRKLY